MPAASLVLEPSEAAAAGFEPCWLGQDLEHQLLHRCLPLMHNVMLKVEAEAAWGQLTWAGSALRLDFCPLYFCIERQVYTIRRWHPLLCCCSALSSAVQPHDIKFSWQDVVALAMTAASHLSIKVIGSEMIP